MKILVVNCGSSSLKYQLIDSETEEWIAKGLCERIGIDGRISYQPAGGDKETEESPMPDHTNAIKLVLEKLTNEKTGVLHAEGFTTFVSVDEDGKSKPHGITLDPPADEEEQKWRNEAESYFGS